MKTVPIIKIKIIEFICPTGIFRPFSIKMNSIFGKAFGIMINTTFTYNPQNKGSVLRFIRSKQAELCMESTQFSQTQLCIIISIFAIKHIISGFNVLYGFVLFIRRKKIKPSIFKRLLKQLHYSFF